MGLSVPERDAARAEAERLLQSLPGAFDAGAVVLARPNVPLRVAGAPFDVAAAGPVPRLFAVAAALRQRLTIADMQDMPAYRGTRLAEGGAPLRSFASVPLILPCGAGLGALCVADTRPRMHEGAAAAALIRRMGEAARMLVPLLAAGAGHDEAARPVRAEEAARPHAAARRYQAIYEGACARAGFGAWTLDLASRKLLWTDGVYDIFGVARGTRMTLETALALYDHVSRRELEHLCRRAMETGGDFTLDVRIRDVRGALKWVRVTGVVDMEGAVPARIRGFQQDITGAHELQERLHRHADRDARTGLASRAACLRALDAPRRTDAGALLLVRLDGLAAWGDAHGDAAGDVCRVEIAGRLRRLFRDAELIARMDSDVFAVLIRGHRARAELEGRVRAALAAIMAPVTVEGRSVALHASIGVAQAGDADTAGWHDLLARAEAAMSAPAHGGHARTRARTA